MYNEYCHENKKRKAISIIFLFLLVVLISNFIFRHWHGGAYTKTVFDSLIYLSFKIPVLIILILSLIYGDHIRNKIRKAGYKRRFLYALTWRIFLIINIIFIFAEFTAGASQIFLEKSFTVINISRTINDFIFSFFILVYYFYLRRILPYN